MRRVLVFALLAAALSGGEVVDRLAVTAKLKSVTLGEIRRYIKIVSMLEGTEPDNSPANLRKVAELLVNQRLIRTEMEFSGYQGVAMSAIDKPLQDYIASRGFTHGQFIENLARYGFGEEDFKREMLWRYSVAQFVNYRFRPVIQVSDEEIEEYYSKTWAPEQTRKKPGEAPPPLADVRDQLARTLEDGKVDRYVEEWLEEQRKQNNVVFHEEALR